MTAWRPEPPSVPEVSVDDLASADLESTELLDVRQPHEYEAGHVPGAKLIPLDEVVARAGEVPTGRKVYVICETGPRSAKATQFYRSRGIDAYNVTGGTQAWIASQRPVAYGPDRG